MAYRHGPYAFVMRWQAWIWRLKRKGKDVGGDLKITRNHRPDHYGVVRRDLGGGRREPMFAMWEMNGN
jgi:hypothetical protein